MGKKKAGEDAAAAAGGEEAARVMDALVGAARREQAERIVEEALAEADAEIYEDYLKAREVPFLVEQMMRQVGEVVRLAFERPDGGERREDVESSRWRLGLVSAPESSEIDTWARGAIPTRKKRLKKGFSQEQLPPLGGDGGARLPSESGRSKTSRSVASKMRGNKSRETHSGGSKKGKQRGQIADFLVPLECDDETQSVSGEGARRRNRPQRDDPTHALAEMEAKAKAADASRKARLAEDKKEEARAKQLAKDLRGKDFVLDENGEVIVIKSVQGDKLPVRFHDMEHAIPGEQVEEDHIKAVAEMEREAARNVTETGKDVEEKGDPAAPFKEMKRSASNTEYYRSAASFQQCVLKNPTLDVKPGVMIREDGAGKSGPSWQDEENRMSREAFRMHQSLLESQCTQPTQSSVVGAANDPVATSVAPSNGVQGDSAVQEPSRSAGGIKQAEPEATPRDEDATNDPASQAARVKTTEAAGEEELEDFDPNLALLSDPNWGQTRPLKGFTPAVLPSVPREGATSPVALIGSPDRKPRDRVAFETNSLQTKTLPPPQRNASVSPRQLAGQLEPLGLSQSSKFESVADTGKITVESDRAFRMLGVANKTHLG